jgi:hypothetical protein
MSPLVIWNVFNDPRRYWFVEKNTCFNVESTCQVCGSKATMKIVMSASGRNFLSPAPHRETRELCRVHIWSPIYLDEHFSAFFFLGSILWCSWSGDDPQEKLGKFGCKLKIWNKNSINPFYIFGYELEPSVEIWWFFLNFDEFWLLRISNCTWF